MAELKEMDYMGYKLKEVKEQYYTSTRILIYKNGKSQTRSMIRSFQAAINTVDSYLKNNYGLEAHYQQTAAMHAAMR